MTDILRKMRRTAITAALVTLLLLSGGFGFTAAAFDDIGTDIPGNWNISLTEVKQLLDAAGHQWREKNMPNDVRIYVNSDLAGKLQLKYIFADDVLSMVQRNRSGMVMSVDDFDRLLKTWEAELLPNWQPTEVLVAESDISEDVLNGRITVLTDGRRYMSISALRHPNDLVLAHVLYYNPALTTGTEFWGHCLAADSGYAKRTDAELAE